MDNENIKQEVEKKDTPIEYEGEYLFNKQNENLIIYGEISEELQKDKCKQDQEVDKQCDIQEEKENFKEEQDQQDEKKDIKQENQDEQQDSQQEYLLEERQEERQEEQEIKQDEKQLKKETFKFIKKYKKIIVGAIIVLLTLIIFYFVMTIYFINHFYFNTEINGVDVSGKSVKNAEAFMVSELNLYILNLKELAGKQEQIKATDIGLNYNFNEELDKLIEKQKPFKWILNCFNSKDYNIIIGITYDEKLLDKEIDSLACFNSRNIIEPKNPRFEYEDNSYKIIDAIQGNKVDKEKLYANISEALSNKYDELDLNETCYIKPKFNSGSKEVIETEDTLNKYIKANITYTFGNNKEIIDSAIINKWLSVDNSFNVKVDNKKIEEYIDALCEKYNKANRMRNFTTSNGDTIQIEGGDWLNSINKDKEIENIVSAIKKGCIVNMDPSYCDIGNTYVEINLTKQHLWFYKNSKLVIDGDVVTGNLSTDHETPPGVYSLKFKAKNAILRGPDYACPVAFWMPFYNGMGIHDATWRSYFGGQIYKTNGSHGCINCPYKLANVIYDNIEPGTPIVCYYSTGSGTN